MSFIFSHQLLFWLNLVVVFSPSVSFKHSQHSFITLANEFVLRNIRPQLLWQSRSCRRATAPTTSSHLRREGLRTPATYQNLTSSVASKKQTQKTKEKKKEKEIITTALQSLTPKTRSGQYLQYKLQYNTLLKI